MKKERLDALGQVWLGEHRYKGLCRFFERVWEEAEQYDYCVFLARRCYNLNELFFSSLGNYENVRYIKALSNNALLLEGKAIARTYLEHGELPSILLVDDILIHGRSLTFCLYRLEQKVRFELEEMGASPKLLSRLHAELVQAVQIRVYLEHDENILLSEEYIWHMESAERVSRIVWHDFSQGVSQLLALSDVANTSFVLSTEGALEWGSSHAGDGWAKVRWKQRERRNLFYYHSLSAGSSGQIVFAVRIREPRERIGTRWIPFVFTGELRYPDVSERLRSLMEKKVAGDVFEPFNRIFLQNGADAQKAQMMQLILSCVVLYYFCMNNVDDTSFARQGYLGGICDVEKISRNFSADELFFESLERLFDEKAFMEACYKLMPSWFCGIPIQHDDFYSNVTSSESLELNRLMESEMYREGLKSEQFAFRITKTGRAYSPLLDDLPPLYLERFVGREEFRKFPLYHCLSCLLMLADSGVTSIKPQIGQEERVFQALRAGEQALFCKPRQLALYMPAMILIEKYYDSFGVDWIVRTIRRFQVFLERKGLELPTAEHDHISELGDFAEGWYKTGAKLASWNIPLLYSMDGRDMLDKEMPWREYMRKMRSVQSDILDVCKDFLRQK